MPALFSGSATFTWRPDGLLGARAWPAGTNETFTYDAAKRPEPAPGQDRRQHDPGHDQHDLRSGRQPDHRSPGHPGRRRARRQLDPDLHQRPAAPGHRLHVNGGATVTYTYNANSNRTSAGATTFTYNSADQLINQTVDGVTRSLHLRRRRQPDEQPGQPDYEQHVHLQRAQPAADRRASPANPLVTYTYDALGRRATRTASGPPRRTATSAT